MNKTAIIEYAKQAGYSKFRVFLNGNEVKPSEVPYYIPEDIHVDIRPDDSAEGVELIYFIVYIIITLIISYLTYKMATDAADIGGEQDSAGIKANTKTTREALRIIYGTARVGGNDVWGWTGAKHNKKLLIAMTVSEGEVEGIKKRDSGKDEVYIDDNIYTKFNNKYENVKYTFFNGSADQTVHSRYTSAYGANFTDPMENTAYMAYELRWDENKFRGIPKRETIIEGLKLHDMRVPSAANAFSDNPALVLWDFMTSKRYGLGLDSAVLDTTTFSAAANYIDSLGWGCNLVVTRSNRTAWSIIEEILATFRGTLTYFNSKYFLKYSDLAEESSVMTLEDKHILQDSSGRATISLSQPTRFGSPTGVRVSFIDPDRKYVEDYIMIGEQDGPVEDVPMLAVNNRSQARTLGFYALERAKLNRTIAITARDDALLLEPHDLITLTSTALGISEQLMRVEQTTLQQNGLVNLVLKYESILLYNNQLDTDVEDVYEVDLPDPTLASVISNVVLSEETEAYRLRTFTNLLIDWDLDPDDPWYKYCEVWVATTSAGEPIPDPETDYKMQFTAEEDTKINNVAEGFTYYVILRTVNRFGVKQDLDEATMAYRTIVGVLPVPPPSLERLDAVPGDHTLLLTAPIIDSPDIELYEFRVGTQWSGAVFLSAKRSPTEHITQVKSGTWTFWCNTKGYNGLYGDTPRSATVTIADPQGWTFYQEWTDDYTGGDASIVAASGVAFTGFNNTFTDFTVGAGQGICVAVVLQDVSSNKDVLSVTWDSGVLNQSLTELTEYEPSHGDMELSFWYLNDPTAKTGDVNVLLENPGQRHGVMIFSYHGDIGQVPGFDYVTDERNNNAGGRVTLQPHPISENQDIALAFFGFDDYPVTLVASGGPPYDPTLQVDVDSNFTAGADWELIENGIPAVIAWTPSGGETADNSTMGIYIHGETNAFFNTEHVDYIGTDWLKSSHSSAFSPPLSGSYLTKEWETDFASPRWYLAYTEEDILTIGGGTLWSDLLDPLGVNRTWAAVDAENRTWQDMFEVSEAPKVFIEMWYKENEGDSWTIVTNAQISQAVIYGQFFRVRIAIEDPATNINAYVSDIKLELYYQA